MDSIHTTSWRWKIVALGGFSLCLFGCATDGPLSEPSILPTMEQVKDAAKASLLDPCTWVPLAGAGLFAIDDFDERVVAWADKHHPIFSSRKDAGDFSDEAASFLDMASWTTAAFTPRTEQATDKEVLWDTGLSVGIIAATGEIGDYGLSPDKKTFLALATIGTNYFFTVPESQPSKTRLMATQWLSQEGNTQATWQLKNETNRVRPNGDNDHSFPSGHTSSSFTSARLTTQNLKHYHLDSRINTAMKAGLFTVAAGTGWARVEANKHYPSDVLFGAALGNFIASFFSHLLINGDNEQMAISISPMDRSLGVDVSLRY